MMKYRMLALVAAGLSAAAACAATNKVEKTMRVARCQAVDDKGAQCRHQTEEGKQYCWRHRGVPKAVDDFTDDTAKGARKTWQSTKQWTTNAWQKTKDGAQSAWDSTKDAANEARVGIVELFGGKDAKGDK